MATMVHEKPHAIRMDDKGRISLPIALRKALDLGPGDTVFARQIGEHIELMKSENPFDGLARYAIKEFEEGRTITLEEWANREGASLDQE